MHRSWLRDRAAARSAEVRNQVVERARTLRTRLLPPPADDAERCGVCGRALRGQHRRSGTERACSAACARRWAERVEEAEREREEREEAERAERRAWERWRAVVAESGEPTSS
ncbi:hypothetical protein [Actinoalloteichus spitiensis]|uniref:hypothetical protein n=1 Tax=Actinoalloteichus spitiensis TaxID=252394 RepID=UPI00037B88ED|nr:hypothetical protein [Actinoalloteichus spitiensis]